MNSPARLFLALALTSISCTLAQLDSVQTQSINSGVFRNNRNPTTTTTPITILPKTTIATTIPSSASPQQVTSQASSLASQSSAVTTTTTSLAPEFNQKQKSQILTPLRTTNRTSTNNIAPPQETSITSTQSSTTAAAAAATATATANDDSGLQDADPFQEDLCIVSRQDAYQVGAEWLPNINCQIKCRCVFRDELIHFGERRWETENWKPSSYPTEIRCSLPKTCPDISDRLSPTKNCPYPVREFPSPPPSSSSGSDFESCDCPSVSCASPGRLAPTTEQLATSSFSSITPQRYFPSLSSVTATPNIVIPPTFVAATITTTTPPPTTTTTMTTTPPTTTTTQETQTTPTTAQPTTTSITSPTPSPAAPITTKITENVPSTTKLSHKLLAIQSQSQSPTTTTTTTTTTTAGATEGTTLVTVTDPATTITTTYSSVASPTIETSKQTTTTTTGEVGLSPAMSIIQAIEAPLERYAAHLLIALAIMTSLFVVMSFMYLRRAFRSSMVPISDFYESPAFKNRGAVLLIDEADHQNFRNKNKEVDGFSPLGF